MNKIELLAPAGSIDSLIAACNSGADAIYIGGSRFSARAFAKNFDDETIKKAVEYAHIRNVMVYVTVNILVFDDEISEILDYIYFLYTINVDGIIVQDVALIKIISEYFSGLNLHCSTQMTIHSVDGIKFLEKYNVKRVVLARELSIDEVKAISSSTKTETEIFIHGALCVCYSGQCLMSSMIGGRSGNRGMCAQPCRKQYSLLDLRTNKVVENLENLYLLSTKDLCTYESVEQIIKTGVSSLKIEGRMKKPEYVAVVVWHYKSILKNILCENKQYKNLEALNELMSIFNRKFTHGYLFSKTNKDIVSIDRPDNRGVYLGEVVFKKSDYLSIRIDMGNLVCGDGIEIVDNNDSYGCIVNSLEIKKESVDKANSGQIVDIFLNKRINVGAKVYKTFDKLLHEKAMSVYANSKEKIPVKCKIRIEIGQYPVFIVEDERLNIVEVIGDEIVQESKNISLTHDKIEKQINKTGDTPYDIKSIVVNMQDKSFMSIKNLNELRRKAFLDLDKKRAFFGIQKDIEYDKNTIMKSLFNDFYKEKEVEYIAGVVDLIGVKSAISAGIDSIYLLEVKDIDESIKLCKENNCKCFLVLPSILKDSEAEYYKKIITSKSFDGIVVSNIGQIYLVKQLGIENIRGNYTLNVTNSIAANFYNGNGVLDICLSLELNIKQLRKLTKRCKSNIEALVYGYIPIMTTEYCPISNIYNAKDNKYCDREQYGLKDAKGKIFRVRKQIGCRMQIMNSDLLFMPNEIRKILAIGVKNCRMDFYFESSEEITKIIRLYKDFDKYSFEYNNIIENIKNRGLTRGHYFRGLK